MKFGSNFRSRNCRIRLKNEEAFHRTQYVGDRNCFWMSLFQEGKYSRRVLCCKGSKGFPVWKASFKRSFKYSGALHCNNLSQEVKWQRHFNLWKGIIYARLRYALGHANLLCTYFYYIIAAAGSESKASEQCSRPNSCCGLIFQILSQRIALWLSSRRPCMQWLREVELFSTFVKQHVYIVNVSWNR